MSRNVFFLTLLLGAAAALLLSSPVVAEDEDCWVCGTGATCDVSEEPGFARKTCRSTDICANGECHKICVTGSEECAIEDPGGNSPPWWWPWNTPQFFDVLVFASSPDAMAEITRAFDSRFVGALASQRLQGRDVGPGDGVIAFQGGEHYRFSRRVEVSKRGLVTATYRILGHPDYSRVTIESPSRGIDVFVTVEKTDRSQRFESFSFELMGAIPEPAARVER